MSNPRCPKCKSLGLPLGPGDRLQTHFPRSLSRQPLYGCTGAKCRVVAFTKR